ncbi:hypothetical protein [Bdellovibrio sp. HCB337]|uniref:hypothetical protein n=1 Tax=Bdellovibrio sp. HCB337 TaxID=3394358 RepID=UPI0039A756CA
MSKTAVMFSGIDGLDNVEQRDAALLIPEVRLRLEEAHDLLLGYSNGNVSLIDYSKTSQEVFQASLSLKAMLGAVTHVGLYDRLMKFHPTPDYLVGCSLGDSARIACSGAMTFEQIMLGTYLFGLHGETIQGSSVVCVKSLINPLSPEEIKAIESRGLYIAVYQTPKHFLVGGPNEILQAWCSDPTTQSLYGLRPLCDKPLHSKAMNETTAYTFKHFGAVNIQDWEVPMVSTALCKLIETREDLLEDMNANMTGSVYWHQTYRWMIEELGVRKFINIGPAETLIRFHERMDLITSVDAVDSLQAEDRQYSPIIKARGTSPSQFLIAP